MDLSNFLKIQEIKLLDGAMGTQLAAHSLEMGGRNNLTNPDEVLEIHKAYSQLGCRLLTTNTLTMNRIYIETHNVNVDVRQVNHAGAKLAKQAAGDKQYVLGDISSTGQLLKPYGTYSESDFYDTFKEQAQILAESGVDGFIIETICDLQEALCALRACKDNFSIPVIVSISFTTETKGARTIMGNTAQQCAEKLTEAGADVIGTNCGDLDPSQMAKVVYMIKSNTALPVLAQPNAGKPKFIDNVTVFDMSPALFASGIKECLNAGATLIGGCCGTTPQHINAVANNL